METSTVSFTQLASSSKDIANCLLTIGENRLELLAVELREEADRLLRSLILALAMGVFGLLGGMTFTAAIVVLCWGCSPIAILLILTGIYGLIGLALYRRLTGLFRGCKTLSATLDQLQKDITCMKAILK